VRYLNNTGCMRPPRSQLFLVVGYGRLGKVAGHSMPAVVYDFQPDPG